MRTLELLSTLNERETKELGDLVQSKKRKGLQILLTELLKYVKRGDGVPANEDLFFKVFNQKYSSAKNYLLRNELRLLNEIIYDYLINDTFHNYLKKHRSTYHVWLARALFDRKIKGPFNADIDRFIDYAKEHVKAEDSAQLNDLKSLWMIYTYEKNAGNIEAQRKTTEEWKNEQIRHLKYRLREIETRNAYLDFSLRSITGNDQVNTDFRTEPQQVIDLNDNRNFDSFENYLILKKHSYQAKGEQRIEILRQMLAFEESKEYHSEFQVIDSQISSINALAMEHILLGHFEKANDYMLMGIKRSEENQRHILPALMQNYIANQVNLGNYQTALDFYTLHETEIKNSRQFLSITIYKAYSYLFLGKADDALATLPQSSAFTPHQNLMVRMVYLIAFIIRKQHDVAMNDCYNISRMVKANEGAYYQNYSWINTLFSKYLDAIIMEREPRKAAMKKIKADLDENHEKVKSLLITEFALKWLVEELQRN